MMLRIVYTLGLAAGLSFLSAGCSKYAPVEGIVLLDGNPVAGATVMFVPEDPPPLRGGPRQANSLTDDQGRFRLETVNKKGAIPAGYKVMISKKVLPEGVPKPTNMAEMMAVSSKMIESLPKKYTQLKTTPLKIDVTKSGNRDVTLAMDSKEQ